MPTCLECGFTSSRLQWTHFAYKCTGKFKNGTEYKRAYPNALLVDPELAKKTAVTQKNLIEKYGEIEGEKAWESYVEKQRKSNSYEYKKARHGWSKEEFQEFNRSRAVTLKNLIAKYGEESGTHRWIDYCDKQAYTNTKEYFIEKYGIKKGNKKYVEVCSKKSHTIEAIQQRYNCSAEEAIQIRSEYNTGSYVSDLELEFVRQLELELGETLDYSANNKQYCVYANNKPNFYDIVHKGRAIEFNGDYWHCNPEKYSVNYYHSQSNLIAEDIWQKDKEKIDALLNERGIPTLVVWESEFKNNTKETIKRCIKWLKQKDSELNR